MAVVVVLDGAAHVLGEGVDDGEAEADGVFVGDVVALVDEALEEAFVEVLGDAGSVVGDGDFVGAAVFLAREGDLGSTVFFGVGEEVSEDLAEAEPVGADDGDIAVGGDRDAGALASFGDFLEFGVDFDVFEAVVEGAGVQPGHHEEVFDYAGEVF